MNGAEVNEVPPPAWTSRAWYEAPINEFLRLQPEIVAGLLSARSTYAVLKTQSSAWAEEVQLLQQSLQGVCGQIFLEFTIPRIGRRIDAVVVADAVVIAIEFKVGSEAFESSAIEQVWDYALDLKNFHEGSHAVAIVPVLVATAVTSSSEPALIADSDGVYRPIRVGANKLQYAVSAAILLRTNPKIDPVQWAAAPYRPTPTIIEAARALYANHSVESIARSDAGALNLYRTSSRIDQIVDMAMTEHRKVICFVTGVPGAGKTLVGLNVATRHRRELGLLTHAVYLSGNGPLVAVLSEVLTRDALIQRRDKGELVRKSEVRSSVKAFIQNVHHFRDEGLRDVSPPSEHVVIFDEAQRAWNARQTGNFLKAKKGISGLAVSEPELLISYMGNPPFFHRRQK